MKKVMLPLLIITTLMLSCDDDNNSPTLTGTVLGAYTVDACSGQPWLIAYTTTIGLDTIIATNLPARYREENLKISFKRLGAASLGLCTTHDTRRPRVFKIGDVSGR